MAPRWLDRAPHDGPAPILLHIGGPSTGTTYLQRLMAANEDRLADAGYLLPGESWRDVVLATHDALSTAKDPQMRGSAEGRWNRLAAEMVAHRGTATVLSMEFLCWAKPEAAARIVESLAGAEVHVVLTVRDTAAVLRSQWQTNCRNGAQVPLRRLIWGLRQVVEKDGHAERRPERMVDRALGVPRVLDTWVPLVGAERVHVVTVPLRSSDPDLLWKRFAGVIGVDPDSCPARSVDSNPSIGLASSELMRLLNIELGPVLRTDYLRTMKALLARDILGERASLEPRVTLNRAGHNLSARWNARVRTAISDSGVDVVGTLDDLPTDRVGDEVPAAVAEPTDEELLEAARWAEEGLEKALARLERSAASLRASRGAGDPQRPAESDEKADDDPESYAQDDVRGADDAGDGDGDGPDREAVLARQLKDRSPEVAEALTAVGARARRAMALGSEIARLKRG
jgi:hypothetical protein